MSDRVRSIIERLRDLAFSGRAVVVGIDGVDGSGKTRFAARLADGLQPMPVRVVHADDHLNPPEIRHARGRNSPEGFWLDTYDHASLLGAVAAARAAGGIVLVEGMFLHRVELRSLWDFSVFLDVPFAVTAARMAVRDGSHPDHRHASMRRYVDGQRLYFAAAEPWRHASEILDNSSEDPTRIHAEDCFAAREHPDGP
ncbi:uridine kinase [Microbacterium sp. W4I4]|uniref:uridine kinase n=1 Tax=Microbacterium sp. W4I4 TaxID=3042295 RepID=UPI00277E8488|nr:uridine kinase [Microbacterium sp. W4I4]MDQ0612387.1 uridine kinase [Microbacterium sp. W4I4]